MQSISLITILIILSNVYISFKGFKNYSFFEKYKFNIYDLKKKEYYRLISSGFLHVDSTHLIFNMITLYFFRFLSFRRKALILLSIFMDFGTPNIFQFPIKYLIICLNIKFNLEVYNLKNLIEYYNDNFNREIF